MRNNSKNLSIFVRKTRAKTEFPEKMTKTHLFRKWLSSRLIWGRHFGRTVCFVRPKREETGNPVKLTAIASNMTVGEAQTSPKRAKSAPLRCEGKPIVWQSEWTHMLWEPSSFGKDQGPRQNVPCHGERLRGLGGLG